MFSITQIISHQAQQRVYLNVSLRLPDSRGSSDDQEVMCPLTSLPGGMGREFPACFYVCVRVSVNAR